MSSDEDDLVPLYDDSEDDEEIVVPDNLFQMKRGANFNGPNGKRQRVFTNAGGAQTFVDSELLQYDFGLEDEEEEDEYDRELQRLNRARAQESLSRGVKGATILQNARQAKKQLTKGQRKLRILVERQNYTNDDLDDKLENDDEGLFYSSVVTPKTALTNSDLGPEEDQEDCYGCSRGVGLARVKDNKLDDLRSLIVGLHGNVQKRRLCYLVSGWFKTNIMDPCNKDLRKGEKPIELWTPRGVHDHMRKHLNAPDFLISDLVDDLREHLDILKDGNVYKVTAEAARSGRKIYNQDIRVPPKAHKMMVETITLIHKLVTSDPKKMIGYNENFTIAKEERAVVIAKANVERTTHLESIFDLKG